MASELKKNLIIVESPSKAKTIEKFLGSRYKVIASKGHVRDLPKSRMGISPDNNFEPEYINVRGKGDTIKQIKALAKDAGRIYLATDPDREGEAISWHICSLLGIDPCDANRIAFNEITENAVKKAVQNPRPIDMNLVNAQQGRRVTDRLVGYGISPVLWAKVGKGLSAGRVQSAALKIICVREDEIDEFDPKCYFSISAELKKNGASSKEKFSAKLEYIDGKKIVIPDVKNDADIGSAEIAASIVSELKQLPFTVASVDKKHTHTKAYAPYTTSALQQDASIRLNFTPSKTMSLAQQLYEGVSLGGKTSHGLITYMRTDSVRINPEADAACKAIVAELYGEAYVGNNFFSNKRDNTQDAHEAIRPSDVSIKPSDAEKFLTADQLKLYNLIWCRFVASRMKPAEYDSCSVSIDAGRYTFRANGRKMIFDGFLKVYSLSGEDKDKILPSLEAGDPLELLSVKSEEKHTEPPSRFTDASLIKELEENGVGRPSTYAPIVSNLAEKRYIKKEKKSLVPTPLGRRIIKDIMDVYFRDIVDIEFTSRMEDGLDKVAEGNEDWKKLVSDYYGTLKNEIEAAKEQAERIKSEPEYINENCPVCGKPLVKKNSRNGEFIGCSGFPDCRYTRAIIIDTGVACPVCGGRLIQKKSRKGAVFYGCENYPECGQTYWDRPVSEQCPLCGSLLVQKGKRLCCSNKECTYRK